MKIETNKIYNLDCLEGMTYITDKSIDMILCDLPYGTTACKWDTVIPLNDYVLINKKKLTKDEFFLKFFKQGLDYQETLSFWEENKKLGLWSHYKRIIKDDGAIILFGSEPFSTTLRQSNLEMYKYDWIWQKNTVDGFFNSRCRPLKTIENILVFSKKQARAKGDNMRYYPQGLIRVDKVNKENRKNTDEQHGYFRNSLNDTSYVQEYSNYPTETLKFDRDKTRLHPTQKPVSLLEYLIKTYTKEGDIVLDNCMGSGSTAIACTRTGRQYIGFELDEKYFEASLKRIYDEKRRIYRNVDN